MTGGAGGFLEGIHYREHGRTARGVPLLLLHGTGGLAEEMEISGLPQRLPGRIVVPDRPGYGDTGRPGGGPWSPEREAALLWTFLDRLGIDRVVVVGHSWATFTAVAMAESRAERVAGLVLMAGYHFDDGRIDLRLAPVFVQPVVGPALRRLIFAAMRGPVARAAIARIFAPDVPPPAFDAFPLARALQPMSQRAMVEDAAAMRPAARRLSARYPSLATPTLIMTGSQDRMVDPEQSRRAAAAIPGAELLVIRGAGHMIHHVAPQETARAIAAFADRLGTADGGA